MTAKVIQIADYRKPESELPISMDDSAKFALDVVSDEWANELVHNLMIQFAERGSDIDFDNPVYGKLMQALNEITLSMTRHHLNVFDEIALTLEKYPEGEITVAVMTSFEEGNSDD